jgi:hypothetical protein
MDSLASIIGAAKAKIVHSYFSTEKSVF